MTKRAFPSRTVQTAGGLLIWGLGVVAGFAWLEDYASTSGEKGAPSKQLDLASPLQLVPDRANLILVAHPRCPCTRATFGQLATLASAFPGRLAITVIFVHPPTAGTEWTKTDLWDLAHALPDARVLSDVDGATARRLGVATSGHVLLYDDAGRLLFSGGVTCARGMAGESAGAEAIRSLLATGHAERASAPVFGCGLLAQCDVTGDSP